jgi:hypothetical protein
MEPKGRNEEGRGRVAQAARMNEKKGMMDKIKENVLSYLEAG